MKQGNGRTDMGFLAQDVEAVVGDGYNVLGIGADQDRTLSLRGTDLIAPLVKAIQEQQGLIEAKDARIADLENQQAAQQSRIDRLERQLEALIATRQPTVAARTEQPRAPAAREPTHLGVESRAAEPSSIRSFWPPGSCAARRGWAFARAGLEEEAP
jgi:phage shock protein A